MVPGACGGALCYRDCEYAATLGVRVCVFIQFDRALSFKSV